jgi:hypothetical protein
MTKITRRSLVGGAAAVGALTGSGATEWAKAWAQASPFRPEAGAALNVLRWRRFVEAEDAQFNKMVAAFTQATGVRVTLSSESFDDLQPKASVAANTGAGPDIFWGLYSLPHLFPQKCIEVTDVADYLGKKYGGWVPLAEAYGKLGNKWISIPVAVNGGYINYRVSSLKAAGFSEVPKDTAGFLECCKALKAKGTPAGFPLGRATGDGNAYAHWLLWSHGAYQVDQNEKITINSHGGLERCQQQPRLPVGRTASDRQRHLDLRRGEDFRRRQAARDRRRHGSCLLAGRSHGHAGGDPARRADAGDELHALPERLQSLHGVHPRGRAVQPLAGSGRRLPDAHAERL